MAKYGHAICILHSDSSTRLEVFSSKENPLSVGDNMTLTCTSDSSNPRAHLSWLNAGDNPQQSVVHEPGDFNAYYVKGVLMITARTEDNGKVITCHVKASGNSLEKSYTLIVTCKLQYS